MSRKASAYKKRHAPIFAALGDETRLSIVGKLSTGAPCSISELTKGTKVTRQAISKHLQVLKEVGLVHCIKSGRENLFALNPEPLEDLTSYLDFVAKQWEQALLRLKSFVEE
jgi:DNA-binding transcriptional ArsR family regulator